MLVRRAGEGWAPGRALVGGRDSGGRRRRSVPGGPMADADGSVERQCARPRNRVNYNRETQSAKCAAVQDILMGYLWGGGVNA